MTPPEDVEAVAQICVTSSVEPIHQSDETPIPQPAQAGDISTAAAGRKPRSLSEVGAVNQSCDEPRDLGRVS